MSPRPRFQKLSEERQRQLLDSATAEFAAHGFDGASLNRIIENSGVSKGAMYYYFDDKADLFQTVLDWTLNQLVQRLGPLDLGTTSDQYWSALTQVYRDVLRFFLRHPSLAGLAKSVTKVSVSPIVGRAIAEIRRQARRWTAEVLQQGQAVGAVRGDLPIELLVNVILSVGEAMDTWLLSQWKVVTEENLDQIAELCITICKRIARPD